MAAAPSPADQRVPQPVDDKPSRAVAIQLPAAMQVYARSPVRWRVGCEVTVLRDGAATYPAMLEAIQNAKESICLETYILASDTTGDRFKLALVERARAGVKVRVIYDAVGSFGISDAWVDDLRTAGIEVIDFNPISPWRRRFNLSHRDHRKLLIVDNEVGFTGGLNIANDYASVEEGGVGWHDMHCRVRGPIVYDMGRLFRRNWIRCGGATYPPVPRPRDAGGPGATRDC
jgi:cardiolipin synthase A/B